MQGIDILETYSFHGEILVKLKKKNSSLEENIAFSQNHRFKFVSAKNN
jgi:hypothetical protein